jgi:molybdate transport system substrate-binding protein
MNIMSRIFLFTAFSLLLAVPAFAADLHLAVAANFTAPMEQLKPLFEKASGHKLIISYGTVGKFYAQIKNGAPFELLISADDETPIRLEKDGLALPETRFTYAIGKLMLWSTKPGLVDAKGEVLKQADFKRLAIASPKLAVYGAAAVEAMKKLGVYEPLQSKFVFGENISQTYQFIATANADLGFVALSQIYKNGNYAAGSHWQVPTNLYPQIRQDAVLLTKGRANPAGKALLDFLKKPETKKIIRSYGYDI